MSEVPWALLSGLVLGFFAGTLVAGVVAAVATALGHAKNLAWDPAIVATFFGVGGFVAGSVFTRHLFVEGR